MPFFRRKAVCLDPPPEPPALQIINDKEKIFNASTCGNNCAKWLLKISENEDVTINLRHLMDFGAGRFNIKVLNTEKIVHNMSELLDEAMAYV